MKDVGQSGEGPGIYWEPAVSQVQSSTLHKSPNQDNLRDFICLVLQRKSLGIREVREVALGCTADKKQNEDLNPEFSGSQILFLSRI